MPPQTVPEVGWHSFSTTVGRLLISISDAPFLGRCSSSAVVVEEVFIISSNITHCDEKGCVHLFINPAWLLYTSCLVTWRENTKIKTKSRRSHLSHFDHTSSRAVIEEVFIIWCDEKGCVHLSIHLSIMNTQWKKCQLHKIYIHISIKKEQYIVTHILYPILPQ